MVLDIWLQGSKQDGIEVLDTIKREHSDLPVVMISGHGTVETAVASIKKGAYDFVEKPFKADRLLHVVERALEAARLKREVQELKLKDRKDWKLMGKRTTGVDNLKLVTGQPLFGVDVQLPNMKVAVFEKCPAVGGKVASANLDEIRKLPGVVDAFVLEGTNKVSEVMPGVAIVADNTWAAFSAKKKLKITWDETSASKGR